MAFPSQHPENAEELAAFLAQNAQGEQQPVVPAGGGTWLDFGRPMSPGVELHTGKLVDVRDYPARDMTITVEAGLPVARLREILAEERQQVPVDFSQSEQATIGGVIAANVSGPRRFGLGTLRDFLIGVTAVDAGGRVFHAGGRVVKNVAGYDLCKLLVGSWGTLAVITQVTLKVVPIPETQSWVWSTWDSAKDLDVALEALLTSAARPIAVEVMNPSAAGHVSACCDQDWPASAYVLALLVAGSVADVDWQTEKLREELRVHRPKHCEIVPSAAAKDLLDALTSFSVKASPFSFRAHLLPSRTMEFVDQATQAGFLVQSHAGNGIVIAHAADELNTIEQAQPLLAPLREFAESQQGSLVIQNCPAEWKSRFDVFGSGHSAWPLMWKLKQSLDAQNLLSPGRLFALD